MNHVVYSYYDSNNTLLYVGFTRNFRTRDIAHKNTSDWYPLVSRVETRKHVSKLGAKKAESNAIFAGVPKFNKGDNHRRNLVIIPPPPICEDGKRILEKGISYVHCSLGVPKIDAMHWVHYGVPKKFRDKFERMMLW
jgi:hypothetical protein